MKIGLILVIGFVALAVLAALTGYVALSKISDISRPLTTEVPVSIEEITKTSELDGLANLIKYYDEVLTQSARNYAFTGDSKWEKRYRDAEPELDRVIKAAIAKGDDKDRELFSSVDVANLALVEMEYRSLELTDQGRKDEAVKILESDEYWRQKDVYAQGLKSYVEKRGFDYNQALIASTNTLTRAIDDTEATVQSSTQTVTIMVVVATAMSVVLAIVISGLISKSLNEISSKIDEISRGDFGVEIKEGSIEEINLLARSLGRIVKTMKLAVLETGKATQEDKSEKGKT